MINFHICSPDHQCASNDVKALNNEYSVGTHFDFQLEAGRIKAVRHIPVVFA